ncbi:AAA family ATPase [Streptomyces sp. NPDC088354]|uniref:AAA family ATPase n=1 Tax=unclassified Streptomyces TaxID=2593676 RepID=UPI0029A67BCC|nr:AAA family ATPase [Streptomyces sp. MI02-7b]MDX3075079.1 AAA family ATPase [Streptomyces sp. MI02-7b]
MFLITGIPASGKSTVAQALAERLPRSAHIRGNVFRRMIVGGRAEPAPGHPGHPGDEHDDGPDEEALRQMRLRYALAAASADAYAAAGFTPVLQDVILGDELPRTIALLRTRPLHVVVLVPPPRAVAAREAARAKRAYDAVVTPARLDRALRSGTPRIGLWLDTGEQTPQETVDTILRHAGPTG